MKLLFAFVIAFLTTSCFAGGNTYCNSKGGRDRSTCYRLAIDSQNQEMATNLKAIRGAEKAKADPQNLAAFNQNQTNWEVQVNNGCTTDVICTYESQVNRNRWLKQQRKILGV